MATKKVKISTEPFVLNPELEQEDVLELILVNQKALTTTVEGLADENRRVRQYAAVVLNALADVDAELLKGYSSELADALHRPEAQTRWEVLDILTKLVEVDSRSVEKALQGAETSLHDEDSGVVRLAAFRFLCTYGATTSARGAKIWPLVDEAIQCYHGDPEFPMMLVSVLRLVNGKVSDDVRAAAAERMAFDAESAKGLLKRRAAQIVAAGKKK